MRIGSSWPEPCWHSRFWQPWRSLRPARPGQAPPKASFKAGLVSDVVGFNDSGFNRNQLKGLNEAAKKSRRHRNPRGVALLERLRAELQRRYPQGREHRRRSRLPARGDGGDVREEVPEHQFAITDYTVHAAPFADKKGNVLPLQERRGHNVRGERVGLPRRRARGEDGAEAGRSHVGAVGGLKIPPVDIWIAGLQVLRRARPCRARRRSWLLERLRRGGQVPDGRAERDRAGREGALPGRGRLRARRAQGRGRRRTVGYRCRLG